MAWCDDVLCKFSGTETIRNLELLVLNGRHVEMYRIKVTSFQDSKRWLLWMKTRCPVENKFYFFSLQPWIYWFWHDLFVFLCISLSLNLHTRSGRFRFNSDSSQNWILFWSRMQFHNWNRTSQVLPLCMGTRFLMEEIQSCSLCGIESSCKSMQFANIGAKYFGHWLSANMNLYCVWLSKWV